MGRIFITLVLAIRSLIRPIAFGVAGAIFDGNGRVLLVRQTYMAGWRLPGGAIARGEAPEAALRRELAEEVGLSGGQVRLFGLYGRKLWWLTHIVALYVIEGGEVHLLGRSQRAAAGHRAGDHAPSGGACGGRAAGWHMVNLAFAAGAA